MVNYKDGKIYKIVDNTNGNIYIGSTCCKLLCQRLRQHKNDYNRFINGKKNDMSSFVIIKNNDYYIELIENYPCDSKDELHKRERHFIKTLKCVNRSIPTRTRKEWKTDNKETLFIKNKEYRENKKKQIKESRIKYKGKYSEYLKKYYQINKDEKKDYDKKRRKSIKNWGDLYYIKNDVFT